MFVTIPYNAMRKAVLEKYFSQTDFRSVAYYGEYDLTEYSEKSSRRLVAVARRE